MAFSTTQNEDGTVTLSDGEGHDVTLGFETSAPQGSVNIQASINGTVVGTPCILRMTNSGGKISMSRPGLDPNLFVVDGNSQITEG